MQYFGVLSLGSSEEPRKLLLDTGSSIMWVTSPYCSSESCDNTKSMAYDIEQSQFGQYLSEMQISETEYS